MSSIKKTAITITLISLVCKLFGFGREMVLAYFFGTNYIVDAYLVAINIPVILFGCLVSISFSFTPIYEDIKINIGKEESDMFTNNIMSLILTVAILGIFLGIIFNRQIVSIAAPGFNGETFNIASYYFNVSIWLVLFMSPIQILIAYLNCNGRYIQSSISTLIISSIQLITIFIAGVFNSCILIYGILIANILQFITLYFFSKKQGYAFRYIINFTPEIKKSLIMIIPIFISGMIFQINIFIDRLFASKLVEGSIASLNYANLLLGFILAVFSAAITTMIYPMLSQAMAEKDEKKLKNIFIKGTNIIIIIFLPITIGAIILAQPAISFVYKRGEFGSSSEMMTTSAFLMYSIGLLAVALREVITKVFYSMQDTKSTLYISIFAVAINIILNTILVKFMGHAGLALATSLSAIISIPLFFIMLRKKIGSLGLSNSVRIFIKASISSIIMGIIVYFGYRFLNIGNGKLSILISICILAGVGGLVYFLLMSLMKVKEIDFFTDIIKKAMTKI